MRILLVSDSYPPLIGGATRSAQQLGRQLSLRGHTVSVATAWQQGVPGEEDDGPVRVHRLRGLVTRMTFLNSDPYRSTPPPFPDPETAWHFHRLIRSFRPDVVHSYGWLTYSCAVALARRRIPLVMSARDYGPVCAVRTLVRQGAHQDEACSGPALGKCMSCASSFYGGLPKGAVAVGGVFAGRPLLRRAMDGLHGPSRFVQATMRDHLLGDRSIPDAVIPSFREDDLTGPGDPAILDGLPAEPFILFVGTLRRIKGVHVLLEAYEQLPAPRPPLVIIGGHAPEEPEFPAGVTVLYNVPHDTVMAIWERALFGALPALYAEPLGNVVHEGMSRGKVVIGTVPGGHADMIVDGETGYLVRRGGVEELQAAMARLIDDPALRERMGEAARERAELFTADVAVPQFEALYRASIAAHSRAAGS